VKKKTKGKNINTSSVLRKHFGRLPLENLITASRAFPVTADKYFQLARFLQPAMVVVEDVDLHPDFFEPLLRRVPGLANDWQVKYKTELFEGGDAAPPPLVLTPLVFAVWEDRSEPLLKEGHGHVTWKAIHAAVNSNRG